MVLNRTRLGEGWVAIPDWHQDHFRALQRQRTCWIGILDIPTNHEPDLSEVGAEYRTVVPGRQAGFDLFARQIDLAIPANQSPGAVDQNRRVVNRRSFALVDAGDDVGMFAARDFSQPL